jgi:hypothetical protein
MFIDLISFNQSLPVLFFCAFPTQGFELAVRSWGHRPQRTHYVYLWRPFPMHGHLAVHQHLTHSVLLGDAGICYISPDACGTHEACGAYVPTKPLL